MEMAAIAQLTEFKVNDLTTLAPGTHCKMILATRRGHYQVEERADPNGRVRSGRVLGKVQRWWFGTAGADQRARAEHRNRWVNLKREAGNKTTKPKTKNTKQKKKKQKKPQNSHKN